MTVRGSFKMFEMVAVAATIQIVGGGVFPVMIAIGRGRQFASAAAASESMMDDAISDRAMIIRCPVLGLNPAIIATMRTTVTDPLVPAALAG